MKFSFQKPKEEKESTISECDTDCATCERIKEKCPHVAYALPLRKVGKCDFPWKSVSLRNEISSRKTQDTRER
jgi:hypothetical protein